MKVTIISQPNMPSASLMSIARDFKLLPDYPFIVPVRDASLTFYEAWSHWSAYKEEIKASVDAARQRHNMHTFVTTVESLAK